MSPPAIITGYSWDFTNDGVVESLDKNPRYTYDLAGTYTVNLTVTGPGGSDHLSRYDYIAVSEPEAGLAANFTADPVQGVAPLDVRFTDTSSGSGITYAWDFENDGTVDSTEQNPPATVIPFPACTRST